MKVLGAWLITEFLFALAINYQKNYDFTFLQGIKAFLGVIIFWFACI